MREINQQVIDLIHDAHPNLDRVKLGNVIRSLQQEFNRAGVAGGYAPLDSEAKVPLANMPATVFTYKGGWNAATNSPALADGAGTSGDTYRVTNAGTVDFGSGAIIFAVGDKAVYNGTLWEKWDVQDENVKTYITQQATNIRVTGSGPSSLGNYRSYLREAGARTCSETNGSPTTGPSTSNGYLLYTAAAFSSADPNNSPSRYEIYIGLNKEPVVEFYRNTGRTGRVFVDLASQWGGSAANIGITWNYDPTTGIVQVFHPINRAANNYIGCDENYDLLTGNVYFDIKC